MRYMIIVKNDPRTETEMPGPELFEAMDAYNRSLVDAGILLAAEGLAGSDKGAIVTFKGGKFTVKDGPFTEAKELVAGFWIIQVKSKDEAIEWVKRIPFADGESVELRKVAEASDFEDVLGADAVAREEGWRAEMEKQSGN